MKTRNKVVGAGAIALALTLSTNIVGKWEGKRNDPYRDIIGVQTVCYGETRVPMRKYTDYECKEMLTEALGGFQDEVLACVPSLWNRPYQLAAATSLAYNIGSVRFCNGIVAKKFRAGDFVGACNNFWQYRLAGGKIMKGLVNRRADETKLCLTDL